MAHGYGLWLTVMACGSRSWPVAHGHRIGADRTGRKHWKRRLRQAQYRRNPTRCHLTTVAGFTMISASLQLHHLRDSGTQRPRSRLLSCGRLTERFRTPSWWRTARICTADWRRAKQLGVGFKRQVPVGGRFIVDFLASRARLVVEVDGGYHARRRAADARRDRALERLGYRVLRLSDELVLSDLPEAVRRIREALGAGE